MICDTYTSSYVDGRCFVAITYPFNHHDTLLVENLRLDELIGYINNEGISKVYIQNFYDFSFLLHCKTLRHIALELHCPFDIYTQLKAKSKIPYDLSPLLNLEELLSLDIRENEREGSKAVANVDLKKLPKIQHYSGKYIYISNLSCGITLKSLRLIQFTREDLTDLTNLVNLDTLHLSFSKVQSLKGCGSLPQLQCLYLHNNRSLEDISDLHYVSHSLRALRIENCSKISDFSVLNSLKNLELLELSGKNTISSLSFIQNMPHLKTLVLSMNVLDGDLSLCDSLSWAYSEHNRKHYNRKDNELPKIRFYHGNSHIDEWRRFE